MTSMIGKLDNSTIRLVGQHDVEELTHIIDSGAIDEGTKSLKIIVDFDNPRLDALIDRMGNLPNLRGIKIEFGNCRQMDGENSGKALVELATKRPIKDLLICASPDVKFNEHAARADSIVNKRVQYLDKIVDIMGKHASPGMNIDKLLVSYAGFKESAEILPLLPDAVEGLLDYTGAQETKDEIKRRYAIFKEAVVKAHGPQGVEMPIGGGLPHELRKMADAMEPPEFQAPPPEGKLVMPGHWVNSFGVHTVRVNPEEAILERK